jgi:hypothetical protein
MRLTLAIATLIALVAAMTAAGAKGDGSPYTPGLVQGADGVLAPNGAVRFVTLGTRRSTVVAAIGVRTGRVARSSVLQGFYGVPIVAWDGSTGGVSTDGRTLILAAYGPLPGDPGVTRFAVLRAKSLRNVRTIKLSGSWAFDAISPDGSTVYLIEYLAAGASPRYRVRSLNTSTGRVDSEVIADRREGEVLMRGQPVTRKSGIDGRWIYTLYARQKNEPFVHALDTVDRKAYCIDLPLRHLGQLEQMALQLRFAKGHMLAVLRSDGATLAAVDLEKLEAQER